MENWKKIRSFSRAYEADLRKEILKNSDIASVVLASQDSAFLIGEFELYVEEQNVEVAAIVLEEFKGWTKVNSAPVLKPIKIVEAYLKKEQIETLFISNKLLGEYEIYVSNEISEKTLEIINSMKPWVLLNSFETAKQAAYRVLQLEKYDIESVIIKRRASDKHLVSVDLLVEPTNYKVGLEVITEMQSWHFVSKYEEKTKAVLTQKILEKEGIEVLTKYLIASDEKIKLIEQFVKFEDIERSRMLIDENREWIKIGSYKKLYQVEMLREILKQNNINSVFINEKGSMFLLGEMLVYVEKENLEKAKTYIESWKEALLDSD